MMAPITEDWLPPGTTVAESAPFGRKRASRRSSLGRAAAVSATLRAWLAQGEGRSAPVGAPVSVMISVSELEHSLTRELDRMGMT
jgi:hypothetical protein